MRILVDADACPVKDIILKVAGESGIAVTMVASIAHQLDYGDMATVIRVDSAPQAVDMVIINMSGPQDIIVTQDYGLASLVLAKGAKALSPRGLVFTEKNIDDLLNQRYISGEIRRLGGRQRGPRAHTKEDNFCFEGNLRQIINEVKNI